jgi:hypothetical protein
VLVTERWSDPETQQRKALQMKTHTEDNDLAATGLVSFASWDSGPNNGPDLRACRNH